MTIRINVLYLYYQLITNTNTNIMNNVASAIKSFSLDGLSQNDFKSCDSFMDELWRFLENTTAENWLKWYGHEKPESLGKGFCNVADEVLEQYIDGCYNADEHLEALEIILA